MKRHPHQRHQHRELEADVYRDGRLHNFVTPHAPKQERRGDAINLAQQTQDIATDPIAILSNRPNRQYFLLQNLSTSASTVWVSIGTVASPGIGFELVAGASLEIKNPCFADTVYAVCESGTATIRYVEG